LYEYKRIFYVYKLVEASTGQVFYIGKGTGDRMFNHEYRVRRGEVYPNKHLYNKIKSILDRRDYVIPVRIFISTDENLCYDVEIEIIAEYGLENLCNIMEGGSITWQIYKEIKRKYKKNITPAEYHIKQYIKENKEAIKHAKEVIKNYKKSINGK